MPERVFCTEQELVDQLTTQLLSDADPWSIQSHALEFDYLRGRVDVVGVSSTGEVIAFEAKLLRWKDAMDQAYRNTCFAHLSYVVLPPEAAARAALHSGEFERRGVGICSVGHDHVEILLHARASKPIQPVLCEQAAQAAAHKTQ